MRLQRVEKTNKMDKHYVTFEWKEGDILVATIQLNANGCVSFVDRIGGKEVCIELNNSYNRINESCEIYIA